jgi:tRNA-specific 2-thiouridylase
MNVEQHNERVVVAMSGGVDSCASALLLCDQGFSVIGVAMQVWDYRRHGGSSKRATCCAPSDFDDAREIADSKSFPFYVFDFEDSFYDSVIRPFVNSYLAGETPNPCLDCNRKVKFHELRNRAQAFGADKVATGHYAQIKKKPDGSYGLFTSVDKTKDQSYFLYELNQEDLATTLFPVGAMTKPEVRAYLDERGFHLASKPESQDICFVSSKVSDFIERESGVKPPRGAIVGPEGTVVGEHDGVHNYTVGQRKGLGISERFPLYVVDIDHEQNSVRVGPKEDLKREEFFVTGVNWVSGVVPDGPVRSRVKLRYRHAGVLCEVRALGGTGVHVRFLEEWTAVSPGQAAVFYSETDEPDGAVEVLGGGRIVKNAPES